MGGIARPRQLRLLRVKRPPGQRSGRAIGGLIFRLHSHDAREGTEKLRFSHAVTDLGERKRVHGIRVYVPVKEKAAGNEITSSPIVYNVSLLFKSALSRLNKLEEQKRGRWLLHVQPLQYHRPPGTRQPVTSNAVFFLERDKLVRPNKGVYVRIAKHAREEYQRKIEYAQWRQKLLARKRVA